MSGRIQVLRWAKIAGYADLSKLDDGWWIWKAGPKKNPGFVDWRLATGPFPTLAAVQEFLKPSKRKTRS